MSLRLVLLVAALGASGIIAMSGRAEARHAAPGVTALPWRRVDLGTAPAPTPNERAVVLYVSASCPHCGRVSAYVDSTVRADGRRLIVLSTDPPAAMEAWATRTGVRGILARDTARAMRRALDVRFVPTMIAWDAAGRGWRVTGADLLPVRRALEASR
jgi:hypothetical protein